MRRDSTRPGGWDARLSTPGSPVCTPDWLALREPADAAARDAELAALAAARLGAQGVGAQGVGAQGVGAQGVGAQDVGARRPLVIRDLGCGTGSQGRWLAPHLPGPQHWILHERDTALLDRAASGLPTEAADGTPVTAEAAPGDLTGLDAGQLAGTSLVTASALLDLLTADEVDALAGACTAAGCPALLTLSVTGSVGFFPTDPLDSVFGAAFDAHQRRTVDGRRLLGPDAGATAAAAFGRRGAGTEVRPSPWRLGPEDAELIEEWLRGWIAAACEQQPGLAGHAADYLGRRLDACAAADLRVVVGHVDVLALPDAALPVQDGVS